MTKNKKLTEKDVRHIASLANLNLSEAEVEKFRLQLSEILDYVEILSRVDTKNIEPTSQVTGLENVKREDETTPSLTQDESIRSAKQTHNGTVKVKAIFNE